MRGSSFWRLETKEILIIEERDTVDVKGVQEIFFFKEFSEFCYRSLASTGQFRSYMQGMGCSELVKKDTIFLGHPVE